ncbi:MAG: hypothetical protein KDA37_16810, partial [Planctomycetales bacterium]|nr:hypothetical protein [Planctomycetales bacterium]
MRLTLRTLLAYIDNILDPKDQEELAQKVNASDMAHDLLHRTRDVTHRLRLPAPPLDSAGPYNDPNMMAEYLDNVLPPDNVPHFERRCLELEEFPDADSYLAEAANCHHVLTMVLGQRAEIDPELKQHLYTLADKPPQPAVPGGQGVSPPPPLEPYSPEVPDYLRASDRPLLLRLSPAIAALALFGATLWFALGPGGWLRGEPEVSKNESGEEAPAPPPELAPLGTTDNPTSQPPGEVTPGGPTEPPGPSAPGAAGGGLPAELLTPDSTSDDDEASQGGAGGPPGGELASPPPVEPSPLQVEGAGDSGSDESAFNESGAGEMASLPPEPLGDGPSGEEPDKGDSGEEMLEEGSESTAEDFNNGEMEAEGLADAATGAEAP